MLLLCTLWPTSVSDSFFCVLISPSISVTPTATGITRVVVLHPLLHCHQSLPQKHPSHPIHPLFFLLPLHHLEGIGSRPSKTCTTAVKIEEGKNINSPSNPWDTTPCSQQEDCGSQYGSTSWGNSQQKSRLCGENQPRGQRNSSKFWSKKHHEWDRNLA